METAPTILETVAETVMETIAATIPPETVVETVAETVPKVIEVVETSDYMPILMEIQTGVQSLESAALLLSSFALFAVVVCLSYFCYKFFRIFF